MSEYGDDIKSDDTQIHGVMKLGQFSLVQTILEKLDGPDFCETINSRDKMGRTLLMLASVYNNKNAVIWLLKNGADTTIKDVMGEDALTLAKKRNHSEITDLITKHLT